MMKKAATADKGTQQILDLEKRFLFLHLQKYLRVLKEIPEEGV